MIRNYMLHVAANIQEWTHEEEKKYEALLDSLHAQKMKEQEIAIAEAALAEQMAEKVPKDGKKTPNKKAATRGILIIAFVWGCLSLLFYVGGGIVKWVTCLTVTNIVSKFEI